MKRQQLMERGLRPIFFFIVFDRVFDRDWMQQLFPYHRSEIPGAHGDCEFPNSLYFHAVGFVAVEITEILSQGSAHGGKYVEGIIVGFAQSGDINFGGSFPGDEEMMKAVALVE